MATQIVIIQHILLVLIYLCEIFETRRKPFNIQRESFTYTRRLYKHL